MDFKKIYILLFIFIIVGSGLVFYYTYNPQSDHFLLKCPFKMATGLDCPGCGSQRALHSLLHGKFRAAFAFNPIFILAIPYVGVGILFEWFGLKFYFPKIRKFLFGQIAIYIVSAAVILFFILRNI